VAAPIEVGLWEVEWAYWNGAVASIRDADSILILGPGEAKIEIQERLGKEGLRGRIVGMETVDKMTDREIAARVRRRFLKSNRKLQAKGASQSRRP
jgi:hypothetical protein